MWIDSHCHLDAAEFDLDRGAVQQAALNNGVTVQVIPAISAANFPAVTQTCRQFPGCVPAYGIHPLYVDQSQEQDLDVLRRTLECEPTTVAVGEIGLDFFVPERDEARQEWFLVEQLKIARDFQLPVLLHVRRAVDQVLKQLRRISVPGGIAHAFNGSPQQAQAFINLGFKLGFGGALTWSRASRLRQLATTLPLSAIVLETDAPDIPPAAIGHRRNSPEYLPLIAQTLAELRNIPLEDLAEIIRSNTKAVLPRLP